MTITPPYRHRQNDETCGVAGSQSFVFSETIAVRYAYLFDQPLDVLIQGIQLSLHHKNDGDQLFPAAVIQFFQCMSVCHCPAP